MTTPLGTTLTIVRGWLRDHPADARQPDVGITARLESGLRVVSTTDEGAEIVTDMPTVIGGTGTAPTPGTLLRVAAASCETVALAMIAAEQDVELSTLEVRVDSRSDYRGLFEPDVDAAPEELTIHYSLSGPELDDGRARELIEQAQSRSPVVGALIDHVPVSAASGRGGS